MLWFPSCFTQAIWASLSSLAQFPFDYSYYHKPSFMERYGPGLIIMLILAVLQAIAKAIFSSGEDAPKKETYDALTWAEKKGLGQELNERQNDPRFMLMACVGKFVRTEGLVFSGEKTLLAEMVAVLGFVAADQATAREIYRLAKTGGVSLRVCVLHYGKICGHDVQRLSWLVGAVFEIAHENGDLAPAVLQTVANICAWLRVDYVQSLKNFRANRMEACTGGAETHAAGIQLAYETLGCKPSDPLEIIKEQHRKMVKAFHPDVIISKDLSPEFIKLAEDKFKEIQGAYEIIIASRA